MSRSTLAAPCNSFHLLKNPMLIIRCTLHRPFDCGFEAIGEIVAIGSAVKRRKLRQPVAVMSYGAFAELQLVRDREIIPIAVKIYHVWRFHAHDGTYSSNCAIVSHPRTTPAPRLRVDRPSSSKAFRPQPAGRDGLGHRGGWWSRSNGGTDFKIGWEQGDWDMF